MSDADKLRECIIRLNGTSVIAATALEADDIAGLEKAFLKAASYLAVGIEALKVLKQSKQSELS